jgi:tetratricopeptide (TPR) repeat protein
MMNFSNLSNTEVRLKFGTANQSIITTNEYNYNNYLRTLSEYAGIMADNNNVPEAINAYEQCIALKSDYSNHFIELGKLYKTQNMSTQLKELFEKAELLESLNKKGILEKLESL